MVAINIGDKGQERGTLKLILGQHGMASFGHPNPQKSLFYETQMFFQFNIIPITMYKDSMPYFNIKVNLHVYGCYLQVYCGLH